MSKKVQLNYFALFREERGLQSEQLQTEFETVAELYDALKNKHGFSLSRSAIRVAINDEFCSWDARINSGDEIVFLAPVAGG